MTIDYRRPRFFKGSERGGQVVNPREKALQLVTPVANENIVIVAAPWLVDEITKLLEHARGEREALEASNRVLTKMLHEKQAAMEVLFDRLTKAGVDCSDLFS